MGAWGTEPWDNDEAADWFGELWDDLPLVERVHAGLTSEVGAEVVAALWLCEALCRVYVWPVDDLDRTLDAGISAADQLLAGEDDEDYLSLWEGDDAATVRARIEGVRDELRSRKG